MVTMDLAAVRVVDVAAEERAANRLGHAASVVARRDPHRLNDAVVTLKVQAQIRSCYDGCVAPWTARAGYVWFVRGDLAVVDFGAMHEDEERLFFVSLDDLVVHVVDAYEEAA